MSVFNAMFDFVATARVGLAELVQNLTPNGKRRRDTEDSTLDGGDRENTPPNDALATPQKRPRVTAAGTPRGSTTASTSSQAFLPAANSINPTQRTPGDLGLDRSAQQLLRSGERVNLFGRTPSSDLPWSTPSRGNSHDGTSSAAFPPLSQRASAIGLASVANIDDGFFPTPNASRTPSAAHLPAYNGSALPRKSLQSSALFSSPTAALIAAPTTTPKSALNSSRPTRSPSGWQGGSSRLMEPVGDNVFRSSTPKRWLQLASDDNRLGSTALDSSARKRSTSRYLRNMEARRLQFGANKTPTPSNGFRSKFVAQTPSNPSPDTSAREQSAFPVPLRASATGGGGGVLDAASNLAGPIVRSLSFGGSEDVETRNTPQWSQTNKSTPRPHPNRAVLDAERREEQTRIREESLALDKRAKALEGSAFKRSEPVPPKADGLYVTGKLSNPGAPRTKLPRDDNESPFTNAVKPNGHLEVGSNAQSTPNDWGLSNLSIRTPGMEKTLSARIRSVFPTEVAEMFENPLFREKMLKANVHIEALASYEDRYKKRLERLRQHEEQLAWIRASSRLHKRSLDGDIEMDTTIYRKQQEALEKRKHTPSPAAGRLDSDDLLSVADEPGPDSDFDMNFVVDRDPEWEEDEDDQAVEEASVGRTVVRDSAFAPLTVSALKRVRRRMSEKGNRQLVDISGIPIHTTDLQLLKPNVWLNDEIINGYLTLIKERSDRWSAEGDSVKQERGNLHVLGSYVLNGYAEGHEQVVQPNRVRPRVQVMSSFFYAKLISLDRASGTVSYNYAGVRRWTKKFDVFSYDMLLVPVNQSNMHWTLGVINFRDKRVEWYDSMGSKQLTVVNTLLRWVEDELKDKKQKSLNRSEWQVFVHGREIPQQKNTDDCGVFLCKYADFVARSAPLNFSARHMNYFRARMAHELLMKHLA